MSVQICFGKKNIEIDAPHVKLELKCDTLENVHSSVPHGKDNKKVELPSLQ